MTSSITDTTGDSYFIERDEGRFVLLAHDGLRDRTVGSFDTQEQAENYLAYLYFRRKAYND